MSELQALHQIASAGWVALLVLAAAGLVGWIALIWEAPGRREKDSSASGYAVRYQMTCARCAGGGYDPDSMEIACSLCGGVGLVAYELEDE